MVLVGSGGKRGKEVHRHLLSDPKVRAWYDQRALRSRLSADTYLRQLGGSLARLEMEPAMLVELAKSDPDALSERLVSYAANLKREGRLDSYIAKTFDGLRSWLRFRRVDFDDFPKLSPVRGVTLERERVPTLDELRRILDRLSPRGRVVALLMAHSGLRPGVLGSYGASDGLRLGDLPELRLGRHPSLKTVPFIVRVPARLSKTRKTYTTFGSKELASALLGYLDARSAQGERFGPDSPVITVDSFAATHEFQGKKGAGRFLTTKGLVFEIRAALVGARPKGVSWRPYVLRSYCSTRLLLAESQGKIGRDLREAILGHGGGVSARYNVGKAWGEELLHEAREAYHRCEPFLSTVPIGAEKDEAAVKIKRLLLKVAGYTDPELAKVEVGELSDDQIEKMVSDRVGRAAAVPTQEVVLRAQVASLLSQGWEAVMPLGPDQVVVRPPNGNGHRLTVR